MIYSNNHSAVRAKLVVAQRDRLSVCRRILHCSSHDAGKMSQQFAYDNATNNRQESLRLL